MKKVIFSALVLGFMAFSSNALAQDDNSKEDKLKAEKLKAEKKNDENIRHLKEDIRKEKMKGSQEIIIRKSGDKDTKLTVEVNGDKVTINGKPLSEFKDDNVTVNKRNITILDRNGFKEFDMFPEAFANGFSYSTENDKPGAFLGVTTESKETDGDKMIPGAQVTEITSESAAEKAGLKVGDLITKVDDKKIDNPGDLTDAIGNKKPKDEVTIYFTRDGKENSLKATLGERKSMSYSFTAPRSYSRAYTVPGVQYTPRLRSTDDWTENMISPKIALTPGYELRNDMYGNMYPRRQKLGLKIQDTEDGTGVKVLDVDKDSPAEKAGLKKDDIVTEVGDEKVTNTDEAREQLQDNAEKAAYTIKAKRNGNEMKFDIRIPKKLKTANL